MRTVGDDGRSEKKRDELLGVWVVGLRYGSGKIGERAEAEGLAGPSTTKNWLSEQ